MASRWLIVFHVVVFGWILFRAESLEPGRRTSSAQLAEPGPATLWTPVTVGAIVAVIGLQLLPPDPLERLRVRLAGLPARRARRRRWRSWSRSSGATVPSQGVPPFIYFQF